MLNLLLGPVPDGHVMTVDTMTTTTTTIVQMSEARDRKRGALVVTREAALTDGGEDWHSDEQLRRVALTLHE